MNKSVAFIISLSTCLFAIPLIVPYTAAISVPIKALAIPIVRLALPPYRIIENKSLPKLSVPNIWLIDGDVPMAYSFIKFGLYGAMNPANTLRTALIVSIAMAIFGLCFLFIRTLLMTHPRVDFLTYYLCKII